MKKLKKKLELSEALKELRKEKLELSEALLEKLEAEAGDGGCLGLAQYHS